jgi:hypothetical protein
MTGNRPSALGMCGSDVLAVRDVLSRAGCRTWVGGGWGVDALAGRQTRPHRDLDLAVDADHELAAIEASKLPRLRGGDRLASRSR